MRALRGVSRFEASGTRVRRDSHPVLIPDLRPMAEYVKLTLDQVLDLEVRAEARTVPISQRSPMKGSPLSEGSDGMQRNAWLCDSPRLADAQRGISSPALHPQAYTAPREGAMGGAQRLLEEDGEPGWLIRIHIV